MKVSLLTHETYQSGDEERVSFLFEQLSGRKQVPLNTLFESNNPIYLANIREKGQIMGVASMCTYKVISGYKGWIEDVVVDQSFRGKGAGRALIEFLIDKGKELGLTEIFLFTEEEKTAAIALYENLGFLEKDSRLYNLKLQ